VDPSQHEPRTPTVEEAARRRREARAFDPSGPLEPAVLERILSIATLAPSPFNLQPWRFLVVRDEAARRRLKTCARNDPRIARAPVAVIVLAYHHPDRTHLEPMLASRIASGACSPGEAAEIRGRAASAFRDVSDRALWATRWTMSAASLLILAAESLGVASAPVEWFDDEAVRREFGVPDDHSVACLIALGRAVSAEPFPGRLGLDEVCSDEHFGRPWGA
jgi:nitroreductase